MAQIFISYSRSNRLFLDDFVPLIRKIYGHDCLWFDDDIHGGVDWRQMILDEIENCDLFIYLLSDKSLSSSYCQAELREALRLKKKILPVVVRPLGLAYPGNISVDLAPALRRMQYIDLSDGLQEVNRLTELYAAIHRLLVLSESQAPLTLPPPPEPPATSVSGAKKPAMGSRVVYAGIFTVLLVIAGVFGLWRVSSQPTAVATLTLNAPQQLQTELAAGTQTATAQIVFGLTATEEARLHIILMERAQQLTATDAAARVALLALSATATLTPTSTTTLSPTVTSTPTVPVTVSPTVSLTATPDDPAKIALNAWASSEQTNNDWTPFERDFDGTLMMLVPPGSFMMGTTEAGLDFALAMCVEAEQQGDYCRRDLFLDETPSHSQIFSTAFWIDKTEVTRGMYHECVAAGECEGTSTTEYATTDEQPINRVIWFQARDYCEWRGGRLPTEAEWEYAARGPDELLFPWGNTVNGDEGNHCDSTCVKAEWSNEMAYNNPDHDDDYAIIAPVGSYPNGASWVGALDMGGNIWEWTSSLPEAYPYVLTDGREHYSDDYSPDNRVLRGGSFAYGANLMRAASRFDYAADFVSNAYGFRCARSY